MSDGPVDDVRRLLAREGVSVSDGDLQRIAALMVIRRRIDPRPETEPHLTLVAGPWKPR